MGSCLFGANKAKKKEFEIIVKSDSVSEKKVISHGSYNQIPNPNC